MASDRSRGDRLCSDSGGDPATSRPVDTEQHALMWEFSGGGGVRNPYGDFDQIDRRVVK